MSVEPPGAETLAPEDQARANFYALLARLFYGPPDEPLLHTLASAGDIAAAGAQAELAHAWQELKKAAAATDAQAAREEYESVFVGTGKAEVTLYTAAYTTRNPSHNPLVKIRGFLSTHGLGRKHSVHEPEDHVAALCDVMRHLVANGDAAAQRDFFFQFIEPAAPSLCDAITNCERVGFYRTVARLAACFFGIEHSALDME